MHSTLWHFLSISLDPGTDKSALVLAVEKDPAILLALLATGTGAAAKLAQWHESIEPSMLQAVAISMSSAAVVRSQAPHDLELLWRHDYARSLLAEALARHINHADPVESRLIGLLSGVGYRLDRTTDAAPPDAVAADFLADLGCSSLVCDAVRYRCEPLDQLRGTSVQLRVNAVAGHLVKYIDSFQMVPAERLSKFQALTGLGEDALYEALTRGTREMELSIESLKDAGPVSAGEQAPDRLAELVSSASTGAVFYRALVKSGENSEWFQLVNQAGRLLFGFIGVCHFVPQDDGLVAVMEDGQSVRVDEDRHDSNIARSFQHNRPLVATRLRVTDLIERQLLSRFGASHLICLPLDGAGLLVCGIDQQFAENMGHHKALLSAYAEAAGDLYRMQSGRGAEVISLDKLNRRVREITHEVNNPLAIVQNYLRTLSLKLGEGSPVQKDIDAVSREMLRVGNIVQKYAAIGKNDELMLRRVDLNGLVAELLDIVTGGGSDLTSETRLDASIPVMELAGDALRQIILNLLKNAAEALQGVEGACIQVVTQGAVNVDGRHFIEIVISDNGPGMSQEQRLDLFSEDASTKGEGRGLGLGIVKQLLGEMSGSISCRESLFASGTGGTSFQILLPLEQG